jgi:hypothetical protein
LYRRPLAERAAFRSEECDGQAVFAPIVADQVDTQPLDFDTASRDPLLPVRALMRQVQENQ